MYTFGTAIYSIITCVEELRGGADAFIITSLSIISIIGLLSFGFGVFVCILFGTHVYLIFTNQTTAEYLKRAQEDHPSSPFRESPKKYYHKKH
jgi:hypothetical protein